MCDHNIDVIVFHPLRPEYDNLTKIEDTTKCDKCGQLLNVKINKVNLGNKIKAFRFNIDPIL